MGRKILLVFHFTEQREHFLWHLELWVCSGLGNGAGSREGADYEMAGEALLARSCILQHIPVASSLSLCSFTLPPLSWIDDSVWSATKGLALSRGVIRSFQVTSLWVEWTKVQPGLKSWKFMFCKHLFVKKEERRRGAVPCESVTVIRTVWNAQDWKRSLFFILLTYSC